ncbi:EamA family transporter [Salinibacterium sp. TMP30]|uniref:EamA family transporter n=1 Tax=Salinibacterium sp. TMP30 TaxID=3138237 RepID=UPI003139BA54
MRQLRDTLLTGLAPLTWGTTYIVTTELLPAGHPLFASLVRALPAGLIALAIARQLPSGACWWKSAVLGVLNIGAFFPLLFIAAYHLAGTSSMALGVVLAKRWGKPPQVSAVGYAGWLLTAGGLFLLPIALLAEGIPSAIGGPALLGYAWLGIVGGLVAYTLWFRGIRILPIGSVAVLGLVSPLAAAALGAIVLGQTFGAVQSVGFVLAMTAIVGGQITAGRRKNWSKNR